MRRRGRGEQAVADGPARAKIPRHCQGTPVSPHQPPLGFAEPLPHRIPKRGAGVGARAPAPSTGAQLMPQGQDTGVPHSNVGGTAGSPVHALSPQELSIGGLPGGSVLGAAAPTTPGSPSGDLRLGQHPEKLHKGPEVWKNLLTRRAGSRNGRCGVGGDAGPTGSRGRAHTRQHCTSHPRQDITRAAGSLQRAFKGGNGPFPSLLIRQGLALIQTPEPAAYTCKLGLASPQRMHKGHVFTKREVFQQKAQGQ